MGVVVFLFLIPIICLILNFYVQKVGFSSHCYKFRGLSANNIWDWFCLGEFKRFGDDGVWI
jgi:mannose/fructose/N-acetylgalactosamine-specific phosphotransferase system component IID